MDQKKSWSWLPLKRINGQQAFLKLPPKRQMQLVPFQVTVNLKILVVPRRNRALDFCKPLITVFSSTNQCLTFILAFDIAHSLPPPPRIEQNKTKQLLSYI